tara:strand:- start:4292 stop:4858 length:567 start_codon:yes stop_codon:yes gene_type:complete
MPIERTEGPFITEQGEFNYYELDEDEKEVPVRKGQEYIKIITETKRVWYKLVTTGLEIEKINETDMLAKYYNIGNARKKDKYPIKAYPTSAKIDRENKFIERIFARNTIDGIGEIFEVKSTTNATIYKFVTIKWQVGGDLEEAKLFNQKQLDLAETNMKGITAILPTDQLHFSKFDSLLSRSPRYQNS